MVYGRYARREAESIRRAVKCLGIRNVSDLKRFLRQAGPGSRIRNFLDNSWEARSDSGLADLFLHPCVRTYRIDEFLAMVGETRLKPLLFAHDGALQDLSAEIDRLRELDRRRETTTNLVCYLGLETHGPCLLEGTAVLQLNPCLHGAVSPYHVRPVEVMSRLGCDNPLLDRTARRFLRRFQAPVPVQDLSPEEMAMAQRYLPIHFLMAFKSEQSHILPAAHASKLPGRKRLSPFEP